jgi:thymidylate synthase ThyX
MKNEHTSPFEQVVLTFHIKTPIFVARQWVRHRTAGLNEISGRYSVLSDEFYVPDHSALASTEVRNVISVARALGTTISVLRYWFPTHYAQLSERAERSRRTWVEARLTNELLLS